MLSSRKRTVSADDTSESQENSRKIRKLESDQPANALGRVPLILPELLDFSALTSPDDVHKRFDNLAKTILNDHCIILSHGGVQTEFDILEIEFYLQKTGCHEDPYTHGADEQRFSGRW